MWKMMSEAGGGSWMMLFGFLAVGIFVIGTATHAVLGERSFTVPGNGMLVFVGLLIGAGLRYVTIGF